MLCYFSLEFSVMKYGFVTTPFFLCKLYYTKERLKALSNTESLARVVPTFLLWFYDCSKCGCVASS
jgi:hypothetical protein